jgi:hypothetical protein
VIIRPVWEIHKDPARFGNSDAGDLLVRETGNFLEGCRADEAGKKKGSESKKSKLHDKVSRPPEALVVRD